MLVLLDRAWGFGTEAISAPQATLMKMIVEGVMGGNLPWGLVFIGAFISIAFEVIGIASLPVAIGLYLPLELSTTIMLGGLVRLAVDKKNEKENTKEKNEDAGSGILFCSGMIAGEGLVGIILAILAVIGVDKYINISGVVPAPVLTIGGIILLIVMVAMVWYVAKGKKKSK